MIDYECDRSILSSRKNVQNKNNLQTLNYSPMEIIINIDIL
jgi:hypothetical protein